MKNPSKACRAWVLGLVSVGLISSPVANAETFVKKTPTGIQVDEQIEEIRLSSGGRLSGVIVDGSGKPIKGTPVVVGQLGKPIAQLITDAEGRFEVTGLSDGHYQVASYAKVQNYRVYNAAAPANAKEGIVHVMPEQIARAQMSGDVVPEPIPGSYGPAYGNLPPANPHRPLLGAIMNPILIGGLIAGAVAIGVAISEDDDS